MILKCKNIKRKKVMLLTIIPNLPEKNPKILIIDKFADESMFKSINTRIIKGEKVQNLTAPTDTHIDMQLVHLGGNRFVCERTLYSYYKSVLGDKFDVVCGETALESHYPNDIAYNIARVGRFVIHNFKYTDNVIKKYISDNNLVCISVSQGYAKCNVCVVDENSVITEDKRIFNACEKHGINCLLIRSGCVSLKGYKNGFIGGASVKINKNTLAFFGEIEKHPDYEKINDFLNARKIKSVSLKSGVLCDIGSAVVI